MNRIINSGEYLEKWGVEKGGPYSLEAAIYRNYEVFDERVFLAVLKLMLTV